MTDVGDEALDLFTVAEVAAKLRMSKSTVHRLIKSGELVSVKSGRSRRILPEDLAAYRDSLRAAAQGSTPAQPAA